jgi:hypothetical protein
MKSNNVYKKFLILFEMQEEQEEQEEIKRH